MNILVGHNEETMTTSLNFLNQCLLLELEFRLKICSRIAGGGEGAAWRHFTGAKDIAILHRGSELVLFEALKITMDWSMGTGSLVSTAFILKTLLFGY